MRYAKLILSLVLLELIALLLPIQGDLSAQTNSRMPPHILQGLEDWKNKDKPKQKTRSATPVNIRISVKKIVESQMSQSAFNLLLKYSKGGLDIQMGSQWLKRGMHIRYINDRFMAELKALSLSRKVIDKDNLHLLVADGTTGSIFVGQNRWVTPYQSNRVTVLENQTLGAMMQVHAKRIENNLVQVTLTPNFVKAKDARTIRRTTVSSTVIVPDGGAIMIGGLQENNSSHSRGTLSSNRINSTRNMMMLLKVDVMKLDGPKKD